MPQDTFATGSQLLLPTLRKSVPKASTIMLHYPMLPRSLFACFITLKLRAKSIFRKLSLEPELTNTYCTSRRSVPLTNRSIQMLQFLNRGRFPALLSYSLRRPRCLFSASECCLSRAAHFLTFFILALDI